MKLLATTLSFTVPNPEESSTCLTRHFGYREDLAFDGGAALSHPDGGPTLFFLRKGLEVLPEAQRNLVAQGLILALTVADLVSECARLQAEGLALLAPIREDSWGERSAQVADPNGLVIQLVQWAEAKPY